MKTRWFAALAASALLAVPALAGGGKPLAKDRLVVHEWGTFTSIAGKDGVALDWRPLAGKSDLPKFVYTIDRLAAGTRDDGLPEGKKARAPIRMETPVIYFYAAKETRVSLDVRFPRGRITEWYPRASQIGTGIDWGSFLVSPGLGAEYRREAGPSHYYTARETDAAPVTVPDARGAEVEKFLFYRGLGRFDLPVRVGLDGPKVKVEGVSKIGTFLVYERQGERVGWRAIDGVAARETKLVERPALDGTLARLHDELAARLVAEGLYEKEARAMIETWKDDWFEPGLRVLYLLPRADVDRELPLTMRPAPTELVRVFVGRAEVLTPEVEAAVAAAVASLGADDPKTRDAASAELRARGRFIRPLLEKALAAARDAEVRERLRELLEN